MNSQKIESGMNFQLFRKLFKNMPLILYALDSDWNFILSEGYGLKKLGLEPGQVIGLSAKEIYRDIPDVQIALAKAFQGESVNMSHLVGDIWMENYIVPIYDSQGILEGVAGAAIDITVEKKAQKELEDTLNLQQALIDSAPGILYMYNADQELIYWNKNHELITGYSNSELSKMTLMDWYKGDPQSKEAVIKGLSNTSKTGFGSAEAFLRCKNGTKKFFYLTACPVKVHEENCFVGVGVDISDRRNAELKLVDLNKNLEKQIDDRTADLKRANADLVSTNAMLASRNEELGKANEKLRNMQNFLIESEKMAALAGLVAGVAHEVNTPLGIGVTAASHLSDMSTELIEAIQNKKLNDSQLSGFIADIKDGSDIILHNLNRAGKLIQSFKQLSVDQSGEPKRIFEVGSYMEEILQSVSPSIRKTKIKISVVCPESIVVNGYPGAFAQIITNLIMNSTIHAFPTDSEGTITITLTRQKDLLLVVFEDDGIGMPPDVLSRLFEPFFTTKRTTGGTGLGLSVVYSLVTQKLGGTIECKSSVGKGTKFTILFSRGSAAS
ncbi:MAG TPA: PAS domain-containing sensor histidine kinase [Treponemataceae bacterium]|nr:PAS domain-containing sensor histidine kinase [Treponemataceae bacterium]